MASPSGGTYPMNWSLQSWIAFMTVPFHFEIANAYLARFLGDLFLAFEGNDQVIYGSEGRLKSGTQSWVVDGGRGRHLNFMKNQT